MHQQEQSSNLYLITFELYDGKPISTLELEKNTTIIEVFGQLKEFDFIKSESFEEAWIVQSQATQKLIGYENQTIEQILNEIQVDTFIFQQQGTLGFKIQNWFKQYSHAQYSLQLDESTIELIKINKIEANIAFSENEYQQSIEYFLNVLDFDYGNQSYVNEQIIFSQNKNGVVKQKRQYQNWPYCTQPFDNQFKVEDACQIPNFQLANNQLDTHISDKYLKNSKTEQQDQDDNQDKFGNKTYITSKEDSEKEQQAALEGKQEVLEEKQQNKEIQQNEKKQTNEQDLQSNQVELEKIQSSAQENEQNNNNQSEEVEERIIKKSCI